MPHTIHIDLDCVHDFCYDAKDQEQLRPAQVGKSAYPKVFRECRKCGSQTPRAVLPIYKDPLAKRF